MVWTSGDTDVAPEINGNNKLGVIVVKPWQQNLVEQRMEGRNCSSASICCEKKNKKNF